MNQDPKPNALGLRRVMRSTEYFTLAFGSIVGVGWMVVLDGWLRRGGPAGAMLGFLIGGLGLIPVVYVYGRLAERIPEAGSEVAYTGRVFPRGASFAAGWALTLTYVMVCPWEAVALGKIAAYTFPQMESVRLYQIGGYTVYLPFLLVAMGLAVLITVLNFRGVRQSTSFQNVTTFGLLAIYCLFAPLGVAHGKIENFPPPFADKGVAWSGVLSVLAVLQIAPYYLLGFETIPKCAEEAAHDFAPRRFLPIMLLALVAATVFYVSIPGIVALLTPWQSLIKVGEENAKVDFATAIAFQNAFGWDWLVRLIMFGVVLSLLKVLNGNFLAATRLLYAMGSKDMLGGPLGNIHARYRTPAAATLLVGLVAVLTVPLGERILEPISEVGSLTCTLGWLATCLSFCCGAAGMLSRFEWIVGVTGVVIASALVVIVAVGFGPYEWLVSGAWAGLGVVLWQTRRTDTKLV
jgi:amino acid transporter